MWYTVTNSSTSGHVFQIGYATSTDGINWRKNPNAVFSGGPTGSWDDRGAEAPSVVWNGTSFVMFFSGYNRTTGTNQIGVAFSSDGINWQEYPGNPVITPGPDIYDLGYVRHPSVIYEDGTYEMWYTGHVKFQTPLLGYSNVDYAKSKDGIHWTKFAGNPVIPPNISPQQIGYSSYSSVVKLHNAPSLYFLATEVVPNSISYAVSTNATHFVPSNVPLLNGTVLPDQVSAVEFPSVILNGSMVMLWYTLIHQPIPGKTLENLNLAFCPFALAVASVTINSTLTATNTLTMTSRLTSTSTVTNIQTETTTSTVTSVQTETSLSLSKVSTTLFATIQVAGANDPYYEAAITAFAAAFLAIGVLLLLRNRFR